MEKIQTLSLDLETRSSIDIGKCGAYKYAESQDFDILLFGVSVNHGPVKVYDLACGDTVPEGVLAALSDDQVIKWASVTPWLLLSGHKKRAGYYTDSLSPNYEYINY